MPPKGMLVARNMRKEADAPLPKIRSLPVRFPSAAEMIAAHEVVTAAAELIDVPSSSAVLCRRRPGGGRHPESVAVARAAEGRLGFYRRLLSWPETGNSKGDERKLCSIYRSNGQR